MRIKNIHAKLPLALLYYKGEGVKKRYNKWWTSKESSDIDLLQHFKVIKILSSWDKYKNR